MSNISTLLILRYLRKPRLFVNYIIDDFESPCVKWVHFFSFLCECNFRDLHLDPDGHFLDGSGEPEPSVEPRLTEVRVHRVRLRGQNIIEYKM